MMLCVKRTHGIALCTSETNRTLQSTRTASSHLPDRDRILSFYDTNQALSDKGAFLIERRFFMLLTPRPFRFRSMSLWANMLGPALMPSPPVVLIVNPADRLFQQVISRTNVSDRSSGSNCSLRSSFPWVCSEVPHIYPLPLGRRHQRSYTKTRRARRRRTEWLGPDCFSRNLAHAQLREWPDMLRNLDRFGLRDKGVRRTPEETLAHGRTPGVQYGKQKRREFILFFFFRRGKKRRPAERRKNDIMTRTSTIATTRLGKSWRLARRAAGRGTRRAIYLPSMYVGKSVETERAVSAKRSTVWRPLESFCDTRITDQSMEALAQVQGIRKLYLDYTDVTDAGIYAIRHFSDL